jgi:hypothetical protein
VGAGEIVVFFSLFSRDLALSISLPLSLFPLSLPHLCIHGRVPVRVVEDDCVGPHQVDAHSTGAGGEDEAEDLCAEESVCVIPRKERVCVHEECVREGTEMQRVDRRNGGRERASSSPSSPSLSPLGRC